MSKISKVLNKFLELPIRSDLTFKELENLLLSLNYKKIQGSGSRVKFYNKDKDSLINLHKPHPNNILKKYIVKQIQEKLKDIL
jgi:predicted RNA binding protein YcfA (HicA-like mRNA interferase family)